MIVIGGVLVSIKNDDLEFLANEPNEFWKGITEIGNSVFAQTEISSIEIPKGVKIIGDLAFSECKNLKSVKLPEGLEYIEAGAFMSCTNLEELKLPASLKCIGNAAFVFCKKLKEITERNQGVLTKHLGTGKVGVKVVPEILLAILLFKLFLL